jgi:hypothetical protein
MLLKSLGRLLAATALGLTAFNAAALAQTRGPAVMIAIDDADKETIPRGSRNLNRIQRAVVERLMAGGFTVYDEAFVVPDLPPARTSRPAPQLLESVKQAKTSIDVIVIMQVYSWITPEPKVSGVFRPSVRVAAHYLRVRDGQFLGDYSSGRVDLPPMDGECVKSKECLLQQFGENAVQSAGAMGDAIAAKLAADLRSNASSDAPPDPR